MRFGPDFGSVTAGPVHKRGLGLKNCIPLTSLRCYFDAIRPDLPLQKNTSSGSMPIELSGYVYETLRADEEFGLYRARQKGKLSTVLLIAPGSEYPSLGN